MHKVSDDYQQEVSRPEDMSPEGLLRLHKQPDGDVVVIVYGKRAFGDDYRQCAVEFCTSGGQSPLTLLGLNLQMRLMELDNQRYSERMAMVQNLIDDRLRELIGLADKILKDSPTR